MPSRNWGGARPGSGRKGDGLSEKEKKRLIKSAREAAKTTGKSVWDILMMHIYNVAKEPRVSVAAIKIYQDAVIARESHSISETYAHAGVIELPPMAADPAAKEDQVTIQ